MRWLRRFVFIAVVVTIGASTADGSAVTGATPSQRAAVADVLAAYHRAGLALPDVALRFRGPGRCRGAEGRYDGRGQIDVCSPTPAQEEHVIAHELAHAWLNARLGEDGRRAFLALRQLETWNDRTAPWAKRGTEQAAEVITWGILRHPVLFVRFGGKSCSRLAEAYTTLTGRAPVPEPSVCPVH